MVRTRSTKGKPWLTYLPTDILPDVLSNLPVKSLLRFRSVCKTWRSLIDDHKFVKYYRTRLEPQIYIVHSKSSGETECAVRSRNTFIANGKYDIIRAADDYHGSWNVKGCVEGLFILHRHRSEPLDNRREWCDQFMCWNPSVRRFLMLPEPPPEMEDGISILAGLGFDPSIKDYKYVKFDSPNEPIELTSVLVYTLGSNSWKKIQLKCRGYMQGHFDMYNCSQSVCFRGSLYFLASVSPGKDFWWRDVVSYDLRREEFNAAKLPVMDDGRVGEWVLRCDGHSLALALITGKRVTIWSGEGEGGDVTWTQRCDFRSSSGLMDVLWIDLERGAVLLEL